MSIRIVEARGNESLALVRTLFREYAASLPCSAQESLRHQGFEREVATLPGKYSEPLGCILLALDDAQPLRSHDSALGVVALRPLDDSGIRPDDPAPICEMKRMYVRPNARGRGIGRQLCEAVINSARQRGYRMMKLDTEPDLVPAVTLYRSVGFVEIPRYNDDPVSCTLWMGRML